MNMLRNLFGFILPCGAVHGKELRLDVLEGLELQSVAARVKEEHRRLFAGLPLKPSVRFDNEFDAAARSASARSDHCCGRSAAPK